MAIIDRKNANCDGADLLDTPQENRTAAQCCAQCKATAGYNAWSTNGASDPEHPQQCWLKQSCLNVLSKPDGFAGVLEGKLPAAGVSPSLPNCSKTKPCTVPCSTPHSRKWFAHFDRMQGQTDTFAYEKKSWSNKTWAHPERGVVRFLGDPPA